jgi:hypothetical protein
MCSSNDWSQLIASTTILEQYPRTTPPGPPPPHDNYPRKISPGLLKIEQWNSEQIS